MPTFCVTQFWCCLTFRRSTQLMFKLEQSETHRKRKSFTVSQTWKQPRQSGESMTFVCYHLFPRQRVWWRVWTPSLKQPRSAQRRKPQLGCIYEKQPRQRASPGSKQFKDTMVPPSRIARYQRSNRAALPHRMMMMMTQNSPLLSHGKAVSVHHNSERSSRGCLLEPG